MNQKAHLSLISFMLYSLGFVWLFLQDWKIAIGLFLVLWAYNLERKVEDE